MALDLGDLDGYLDPDMVVRLKGADGTAREYRIPPVAAAVGLWCRRVLARRDLLDVDDLAASGERIRVEQGDPPIPDGMPMEEAMLGPAVLAELAEHGVADPYVQHLVQTQFARVMGGAEAARWAWASDPNDRGPAPNRAQRRATAKAPAKAAKSRGSGSKATSTAAAATTPPPASSSGTSTRRKPAATATATASRGRRSSPTG